MKKIFFLTFSLLFLMTVSCSDKDKVVQYNQLPQKAQQFIETHFQSGKVAFISMDRELLSKSYDVIFSDGTSIEFTGKGEWKEIKNDFNALPQTIIPENIATYVAQTHTEQEIYGIEQKQGKYEIKLSNGIEIKFNKNYQPIEYGD